MIAPTSCGSELVGRNVRNSSGSSTSGRAATNGPAPITGKALDMFRELGYRRDQADEARSFLAELE
jgi:hypothetical protein